MSAIPQISIERLFQLFRREPKPSRQEMNRLWNNQRQNSAHSFYYQIKVDRHPKPSISDALHKQLARECGL